MVVCLLRLFKASKLITEEKEAVACNFTSTRNIKWDLFFLLKFNSETLNVGCIRALKWYFLRYDFPASVLHGIAFKSKECERTVKTFRHAEN